MLKFNELQKLTLWSSPSLAEQAEFFKETLDCKGKIEKMEVFQLYFVDATNSFPFGQFKKISPIDNSSKLMYDHIQIATALNLNELARIVSQIELSIIRQKWTNSTSTDRNFDDKVFKVVGVLIIVNGIQVMFRNTQISDSTELAHTQLRDLLLKLRMLANSSSKESIDVRSVILTPATELLGIDLSNSLSSTQLKPNDNKSDEKKILKLQSSLKLRKKPKLAAQGNSVAEYIAKFYADSVI